MAVIFINFTRPVAQSVEYPLPETGGYGFNPGPGHTKVIKKIVLAAPRFALITGCTIKVSIELPLVTRHLRDITEKLLKAS